MKYKHLKGASIALIAMGKSSGNYNTALAHGAQYDEVWGINVMGAVYPLDRLFMLDPASRFLDTELAGSQTAPMRRMLTREQPFPIYTCELDSRCPSLVEYPLADVIGELKMCYFNNTAAYALAYALYQGVGQISLFGLDYTYRSNIMIAEAGRGCCEFWLAMMASKDIKISVAPESSLLDTDVPDHEKLYGYHRLDNPLVASFNGDNLTITRMSECEHPPEPKDPVLYKG